MVAEIALPSSPQGHLRRIDMRRDLAKVADLVELCFSNTLDPEGRQYLKEMRRAAQNSSWLAWASNMIENGPMPPSGYIWEENGQLVGNLSLIPINIQGRRGYMIANVATHPEYRGRGIAKALTAAALDYAHRRNSVSVWLQVRDDNPTAVHIYDTAGFIERIQRTSWYSGPRIEDHPESPAIKVSRRRPEHWVLQREWLKRIYPPEMEWHLPFDWNLFRVDLWGSFYRFFNMEYPMHWSVEDTGELKGVLTWKYTRGYTSPLWLAIPREVDEPALLTLLAKARRHIRAEQPLSLNYPAGLAADILLQAGFYPHQTLVWMEHTF